MHVKNNASWELNIKIKILWYNNIYNDIILWFLLIFKIFNKRS